LSNRIHPVNNRRRPCWGRLVLCALGVLLVASPVLAQDSARRTTAMREKVYDKLSKAQEATEAGNWDKAFDYLGDVERMRDLDSHEKAQLYTAYGYTYFAQEKYAEAIGAYEKVLLQEEIPEALRTNTLYTLGQLYFHQERYVEAAGHLENWLASADDAGPEPYVLLGQAYYQLGRPKDAAASIEDAVAEAAERGKPAQESWYALLRAIYFELGDYDKLLAVLETLVTRYPAKEYWIHLSAAYGEKGDTTRQLAAYEMAHVLGYLTTGREIVLLSQLLMRAGVPHRAGVILEQALADGVVEGTAGNWRLLSQAWTLAQEHETAIVALTRGAELAEDGELNARIAQSHANLGQWDQSVEAARVALQRGVDNPHEMQVLLGMALFELGKFDEAKSAFSDAQSSPEGRATAVRWLAYVEREEKRLRELGLQSE
jgi:tetratricopeptide (TPR) repeat protein